jgi:hypothetical protein
MKVYGKTLSVVFTAGKGVQYKREGVGKGVKDDKRGG